MGGVKCTLITFTKDPFSVHSAIGTNKGLSQNDVNGHHLETAPSTTSLFRPGRRFNPLMSFN